MKAKTSTKTAAKTTAKKAETAVKETVKNETVVKAEAVKAEAVKTEEKAVKAETTVKAEAAEKTEAAAKKTETAAKKTAAKRTTAKKAAAVAETVYLQYLGKEINKDDLVARVKEVWAQDHKEADLKSVNLYLKPEENAAYYVVNGSFSGKLDF